MDFTRRYFDIPCSLYLHVQKFSQSTVKYFDICEDNRDFTVSLDVRWKINFQSTLYDVGGKFWIEVECKVAFTFTLHFEGYLSVQLKLCTFWVCKYAMFFRLV